MATMTHAATSLARSLAGLGPIASDHAIVDAAVQNRLAVVYLDLPAYDNPRPWELMARDITRQYDQLERAGFSFSVSDADPYDGPRALFDDVSQRRIAVLSTASTGGHPVWDDATNDAFRAVHDVFGHAASGRGFDRHGEEAAYRRHARMFHGEARLAMATETRGQNAALHCLGRFASERIATLPSVWIARDILTPTTETARQAARADAARYMREAFGS